MRKTTSRRASGHTIRTDRVTVILVLAFAVSLVVLNVASPALAGKGEFKPFANCPIHDEETEVTGCVYAKSNSTSQFTAGNVTVPLTKPITLRGGFHEHRGVATFVGAEGAETVQPVAQVVPGGLEAIVEPALLPEKVRAIYNKDIEAGRTRVTATIELAGPASSIVLNERNLLQAEGIALGLPTKVRLSSPFLGTGCYVGSNASPIQVELTTGTTSPPPPNEPIEGKPGTQASNREGTILTITGDSLVNNSYAAPGVESCGKEVWWHENVDAAVNAKLGLPAAAGHNSAVIDGELKQASAHAVAENIG